MAFSQLTTSMHNYHFPCGFHEDMTMMHAQLLRNNPQQISSCTSSNQYRTRAYTAKNCALDTLMLFGGCCEEDNAFFFEAQVESVPKKLRIEDGRFSSTFSDYPPNEVKFHGPTNIARRTCR
ncbi:uncharacterized protein LOC129592322 isoform X2 [Paramacrobiotus metropolitanus]|uniref:uncharacterized protein LOC129592322 isoform X2 n=1 Tax=Paramacrobiotus metropolitanus TaxID=2943436 RepID=UPI0024456865|nr:uncharacterized protein LOC129592322 isoform X2 [Paramacrobiotus metropolitanus]